MVYIDQYQGFETSQVDDNAHLCRPCRCHRPGTFTPVSLGWPRFYGNYDVLAVKWLYWWDVAGDNGKFHIYVLVFSALLIFDSFGLFAITQAASNSRGPWISAQDFRPKEACPCCNEKDLNKQTVFPKRPRSMEIRCSSSEDTVDRIASWVSWNGHACMEWYMNRYCMYPPKITYIYIPYIIHPDIYHIDIHWHIFIWFSDIYKIFTILEICCVCERVLQVPGHSAPTLWRYQL